MLSFSDAQQARRRANLKRLLAPRHLVFLGGERAAWAIRVCRAAGYQGQMFAVHPKKAEIEGVACVPRFADLPVVPDAAFVAVPALATIEVVGELARMGAGGAVCYAAGFAELGAPGAQLNEQLLAAAGDLALVGPNCFGVINYVNDGSLWSVPYRPSPRPRGVAVIGQSGNLCINLSMNQREVPFSYIISAGNQAVLGFEDYIDVLAEDRNVTAIGLFLEGIRDVPRFSAACLKAHRRSKPIVALRVGVSELGAKVAASHTNSLAGQNELYDTLFERLGILRTRSVPQFLELLKALSLDLRPKGRRLAVFSSSGGDNGLSADCASAAGLSLPPLDPEAAASVQRLLPDYGTASNPLDFTAGYWGQEKVLTQMFQSALSGGGFDVAAIVIDHPRQPDPGAYDDLMAAMVRAMAAASAASGVPGAVVSVNPESMPEVMRRAVMDQSLIPLQGLHDAFEVLARCADLEAFRERSARDGLPVLPLPVPETGPARRIIDEAESKARLARFGLRSPDGRVTGLAGLREAAAALSGPFALKAVSAALPHKTEAGAVALGLAGADDVVAAAEAMRERVRQRSGIAVERFLLEPMASGALAELIVGVKADPHFGMVLVIGAGGILVELLGDACRLLLPATRAEVEAGLRSLKVFRLLDGYRGKPKADVASIVDAIMAVASYAEAHVASVAEIDVNPLIVCPGEGGAIAVDALIVEHGPS